MRIHIEDMLNALPYTLVPADAGLAWEAGRLRADTAEAGLSLGDRFCLALAKRNGLPAWTADKAWKLVAGLASVKGCPDQLGSNLSDSPR